MLQALDLYQRRFNQEKDSFKKGLVCPNLAKPIFFYKEVSLSPYFRYGCLSVRKFYFEITKLFFKVNTFFLFLTAYILFLNFS